MCHLKHRNLYHHDYKNQKDNFFFFFGTIAVEFPPTNKGNSSQILCGTQHLKKAKPSANVASLVSKCKNLY